jgi:hypothetical protein
MQKILLPEWRRVDPLGVPVTEQNPEVLPIPPTTALNELTFRIPVTLSEARISRVVTPTEFVPNATSAQLSVP